MRWLVLAVVPACTYITQNEYEQKLDSIDEDHDGSPNHPDCNDEDPAINPDADDIPYDGIDQNCDGQDLVDADGDGFPGISETAYEALGSKLEFPAALKGKPLDCDDQDPKVYPDPTKAIEVLYDAIDSDCQHDNDFDFDGDGFIPGTMVIDGVERDGDEVFQEYMNRWGITPAEAANWAPPGHLLPVAGDCDDRDAYVHPENTTADVPYDGVDRDCDGSNDFDADGDCFMPPLAAQQYDLYVAKYYGDKPPPFCVDPDQPFGDCVDQPDPDLQAVMSAAALTPADIHPNTATSPNPDAPYDSVDADCAADNDFDADADGFVRTQSDLDAMNAYAALWGYTSHVSDWVSQNPDAGLSAPTVGDCDDTRFDTWPGALEILGDGVDQDCAGDVDTSAFGFGDSGGAFSWTLPTNPEIARLDDLFLVMVGAQSGSVPGFAQQFGIAIPFSLAGARGGALPDDRTFPYWKSPFATITMQSGLDIAIDPNPIDVDLDGIPDPIVRTLSNSDSTVSQFTFLNVSGIQLNTKSDLLLAAAGTNGAVPTPYVSNALDLVMDGSGSPFALSCATDRLDGVYSLALPSIHSSVTTGGGDACFFSTAPVQTSGTWSADFELCAAGACDQWTLGQDTTFSDGGSTSHHWVYGDQDEGWISLVDDTGAAFVQEVGGTENPVFAGKTVTHLDVAETDGVVYAAAIVDTGSAHEVWLTWGDPSKGALDEQQLPFDDPHVTGEVPQKVAVYADEDRVAVAVSAYTGVANKDSVGWLFLAPAVP